MTSREQTGVETAPKEHLAPAGTQARVLVASSLGTYVQLATLILYPFGVMAPAIAGEFRVPVSEISKLVGPALLVTIVAQPIIGWILDRWPARNVSLVALALLCLSMLLLSFAPDNTRAFGLILATATLLSCLATPNVYSALISSTFNERRGLALGTVMSFGGLAAATIPVFVAYMLAEMSWRGVYQVFAIVAGCLCLLNAFILPHLTDRSHAVMAKGQAKEILLRAARRPIFWSIAAIFFLLSLAVNALPIFLPLILGARGASPAIAAASLTSLGLMVIVSRPALGFLLDRWSIRRVLALILAGPLAGSALLLFTTGIVPAYAAAAGFGIAIGGEFVCLAYLVAQAFGTRHFGLLYSWLTLSLATGVAVGPIVISWLSSDTSFEAALLFILVTLGATFAIVLLTLSSAQVAQAAAQAD